jgi:hypothetical protein
MSNLEDYLNNKTIKTNLEESRPQQNDKKIVIIPNIARKTNNIQS